LFQRPLLLLLLLLLLVLPTILDLWGWVGFSGAEFPSSAAVCKIN
jgi:hypothetical protein